MTAEEARELTAGSEKHKGLWFKSRLIWTCGRINHLIENAAESGSIAVEIERDADFAKKYYPLIAKAYEKEGYFIAYQNRKARGKCALAIVWDFDRLEEDRKDWYTHLKATWKFTGTMDYSTPRFKEQRKEELFEKEKEKAVKTKHKAQQELNDIMQTLNSLTK